MRIRNLIFVFIGSMLGSLFGSSVVKKLITWSEEVDDEFKKTKYESNK